MRSILCPLLILLAACGHKESGRPIPAPRSNPACRVDERPEENENWPPHGVLMATLDDGKFHLNDARGIRAALESFMLDDAAVAHVDADVRRSIRCPPAEFFGDEYGVHVARYWVSPGADTGHVRLFQPFREDTGHPYNVIVDVERVGGRWGVRSLVGELAHP